MRKLVICNDGTWNSPDDEDRGKVRPTNITKICRALMPVDSQGVSQIAFYDEGVGTGFGQKFIGGVTGFGISKNILDGYRFLSHNFRQGDQIYLFGFSRGAYTSRSLVGLIDLIGLLQKEDVFYLSQLYEMYQNSASRADVDAFCQSKKIDRQRPPIKMLGVFDTVGALGLPVESINGVIRALGGNDSTFHKVALSELVDNAYHAVAIDEHRGPFAVELWQSVARPDQVMEQRWFAGAHSNIGGGYNPDDLANLALQYMVERAEICGLEFDKSYLSFFGSRIATPIRDSMSLKYRVLGRHLRSITLNDASNQVVDESVFKKMAEDKSYQPENVV